MPNILLVEDNDDHALLAKSTLLRCEQKHEVDRVSSAEGCLDALKKRQYDAIVLDYSLPKKNGLDVLKNIVEMSYDAPVVMITSHGDEQIAVEAMKGGAYDYISKTDDYLNKLPRVLQRVIEAHELIREKANLQARIEQSVNQLRNIFENVGVGLVEIKNDCSISYANPRVREYLNIDDPNNINLCEVFLKNNKGVKNCSFCQIRKCFDYGGSVDCDIDYNNKQLSGTITSSQMNEAGEKQLVAVLMDVTEQNKLQKQLIQSERIGALGRMASGVAHDFNNVLASILGRAELMLMKTDDTEEIKAGLKIICQVALDGANTVRRIQEFTGVARQKEFEPIKINSVLQDAIKITEPRWKDQMQREGIEVDVLFELNSNLTTMGDPADLREVLTNIIFNALDAMPCGGSLILKTYDEEDNLCISIKDTGIGIPPNSIPSIFEPFFTSKGAGHSGLGLSVCYGIISRHDGKIEVNSEIGMGTTFIIRLPACTEASIDEAPKDDFIDRKNSVINADILVIDDEEAIRDILANLLARFNNKVTVAHDGVSGIEIFQSGNYDIVFTDLGMPGMSGWEVAQHIKSIAPEIKIVLLTGWGVELAEDQLEEKDIDMVIAKPFQINQIISAVSKLLSEAKGS